MIFLQRVLSLASAMNITKNKLLTDTGLNKNSFVDWERRGTIPGGDVVTKLADYFHVSTDYLLGRTDDPRPVAEQTDPAPVPEGGSRLNTIKIAGRDGSLVERELTDEQLAALKLIVDQLPDADDL